MSAVFFEVAGIEKSTKFKILEKLSGPPKGKPLNVFQTFIFQGLRVSFVRVYERDVS